MSVSEKRSAKLSAPLAIIYGKLFSYIYATFFYSVLPLNRQYSYKLLLLVKLNTIMVSVYYHQFTRGYHVAII